MSTFVTLAFGESDDKLTENKFRPQGKFTLSETCYLTAKAGVLREKTVTSNFELSLSAGVTRNQQRFVDVLVTKVTVNVDVPAQKRKGKFDSATDNTFSVFEIYELIRPAGLQGTKLRFLFGENNQVTSIEGQRELEKKVTSLLNRDFKGTEVGLYASDYEIDQVSQQRLAETWGELFRVMMFPGDRPQTKPVFHFEICVTSESWHETLEVSCPMVPSTPSKSNTYWKGKFQTSESVKTKIGPCNLFYQIKSGTLEFDTELNDNNQVIATKRYLNADID
ncbi:MAG: hypothetical protein KDA84_28695, partial [Planctomycetaceae bacterium]|nr:hypothetical protein [Planctomycetaceae bacterium]